MNLEHLGDALDHWKGSVIELMQPVTSDLHVVPIFTRSGDDDLAWSEDHLKVYARLLRVDRTKLLQTRTFIDHTDRGSYFNDPMLRGEFDLFLDPDNGIEPIRRGCCDKHIRLSDLDSIMPQESKRLAMVYQHSQPYNMRDSVLNRLPALKNAGWKVTGLWSGVASMLFISRDPGRIEEAQKTIRGWLGPCCGGVDGTPERLLD